MIRARVVIGILFVLSAAASLPVAAQIGVAPPNGATGTPTPAPTAAVAPAPGPPDLRPIAGMDPKLLAAADLQLNEVQLQIERLQTARAAANAPLLQLGPTHKTPPNTLAGVAPNLRARVGIDSWWSAAVDLPAAMVVSIRVDTYDGPAGQGYVIVARAGAYERIINVGPEAWRETDWRPR